MFCSVLSKKNPVRGSLGFCGSIYMCPFIAATPPPPLKFRRRCSYFFTCSGGQYDLNISRLKPYVCALLSCFALYFLSNEMKYINTRLLDFPPRDFASLNTDCIEQEGTSAITMSSESCIFILPKQISIVGS